MESKTERFNLETHTHAHRVNKVLIFFISDNIYNILSCAANSALQDFPEKMNNSIDNFGYFHFFFLLILFCVTLHSTLLKKLVHYNLVYELQANRGGRGETSGGPSRAVLLFVDCCRTAFLVFLFLSFFFFFFNPVCAPHLLLAQHGHFNKFAIEDTNSKAYWNIARSCTILRLPFVFNVINYLIDVWLFLSL